MLNYQIALTNVPFDRSYMNVIRFSSRADQQEYFGVSSLFTSAPSCNLKAGTLLTTQITVEAAAYNLQPMMNYNYCIVKDNTPGATFPYLYYFVLAIRHISGAVLQVDVELDVMQTYYIDLTFSDCMIRRAHLNRWKNTTGDNATMDNDPDSPMLNSDGVSLPKRLISRQKITPLFDYNLTSALNDWCKADTESLWAYVFVDPAAFEQEALQQFAPEAQTPVLCVNPAVKASDILGNYYDWGVFPGYNVAAFRLKGNGVSSKGVPLNPAAFRFFVLNFSAYILNIKLSNLPPFFVSYDSESIGADDYEITSSGSLNILNPNNFGVTEIQVSNLLGGPCKFFWILAQSWGNLYFDYTLPKDLTFTKTDIINGGQISNTDPADLEPPMLSQNVEELRITDSTGNAYTYDLQKINAQTVRFLITSPFTVDIEKVYIRLEDITGGSYANGAEDAWVGLVSSLDSSIPYNQTQLSTFMANNKNFAMQQQAQRNYNQQITNIDQDLNTVKMITGIGRRAAGVNSLAGALTATINAGLDVVDTAATNVAMQQKTDATNELSRINERATIDNARAAPGSLQNAQGNIFLPANSGGVGFFVELWEAFEQDKQELYSVLLMFGYPYNRIGNIKDFDNIRRYYNYIQADLENVNINGNLSNAVRERIRGVFKTGVRFWNRPFLPDSAGGPFSFTARNCENALL